MDEATIEDALEDVFLAGAEWQKGDKYGYFVDSRDKALAPAIAIITAALDKVREADAQVVENFFASYAVAENLYAEQIAAAIRASKSNG